MSHPEKGPGIAKCPRLGASMLRALQFVAANPGQTKFACARHVGKPLGRDPAHQPASMYWSINRCIELGFIDATLLPPDPLRPRAYALHITPRGLEMLQERTRNTAESIIADGYLTDPEKS